MQEIKFKKTKKKKKRRAMVSGSSGRGLRSSITEPGGSGGPGAQAFHNAPLPPGQKSGLPPASEQSPAAPALPSLISLKLWDFLLLFLWANSMVRAGRSGADTGPSSVPPISNTRGGWERRRLRRRIKGSGTSWLRSPPRSRPEL